MDASFRSKITTSIALAIGVAAFADAQESDQVSVLARDIVIECRAAPGGAPRAAAEVFLLPGTRSVDAIFAAMHRGESARGAAAARGDRHVADGAGLLHARVKTGGAALFGLAHGRTARLDSLPEEGERFVLDFVERPEVRARVIGPDGTPAGGIGVALWRTRIGGRPEALSSRTDEDGFAHFYPSPQRWDLHAGVPLHCGVVGIFGRPLEIEFRSDSLPTEPIEFRLPPHGSVVVLRPADEARGSLAVRLRDPAAPWRSPSVRHPCEPRGSLRRDELLLGPVEVGVAFEADAPMQGSHAHFTARGIGPNVAGGVTRIALVRHVAARLRGRAIDASGVALGGADLEAVLVELGSAPWRKQTIPLRCDAGGHFVWELRGGLAAPLEFVIRSRTARDTLSASVHLAHLAGDVELGDVRFGLPPLVVAGRAIDSTGAPIPGIRVTVTGGPDDAGEQTTHAVQQLEATTAADGRFEVRSPFGAPPSIFVSIGAPNRTWVVRRAATGSDLGDVVLVSKASLRGRVVLDPEFAKETLAVVVDGCAVPIETDGEFVHDDIGAGKRTVELGGPRWWGQPVPLLVAEFGQGSAIDCGVLDARAAIDRTRLRVRDAEGQSLSRVEFRWEDDDPDGDVAWAVSMGLRRAPEEISAVANADHVFDVLHRRQGTKGRLRASGHRPLPVSLRGGDMTVDLLPALQVVVEVVGAEALPDGVRLVVDLEDRSGSHTREWVDAGGSARFDPDRPGPWTVSVRAVPSHRQPGVVTETILVEDAPELQTFRVRWPAPR